ncbi:hypothetical protein POM88_047401 [Heracleum sosnowskyi]|uniref:F-box domain-containing protein n=1 Tax=Heracleum sosnowskyi TaxID=360622 RepID=A0AAD8GU22_9APIA|nr:hypothetical protein POM88_047401 [Heracleum sosnowskyi]
MTSVDIFSKLDNDVLIKIISDLDLKDLGRLACVSKKLCPILLDFCYKIKCTQKNPALVSDLLSDAVSSSPQGGWAGLFKILFCCPGLAQAGVHVEASPKKAVNDDVDDFSGDEYFRVLFFRMGPHLAWEGSRLNYEYGNYLLDDRFTRNCLYLSDWSRCEHLDEKHNYSIYRGIFINFKQTMIWRELNDDGEEHKVDMKCSFCPCKHTWDLYTSLCFKQTRAGEPVDRAFVCENGHVCGVWIDKHGQKIL